MSHTILFLIGGVSMVSFDDQIRRSREQKFDMIFRAKPELNPLVHCAFHPSEGCDDCLYFNRCSIREDGWFI